MDWAELFETLQTQLLASAPVVIPIGIAVFAALAALGLAFKFLRKGGVK